MKLVVFLIFLSTFVDAKRSNKIKGGLEKIIQQHPYHAFVKFLGHGICAGSIISQYYILTSASCVIFEKTTLTVYAGNLKVLVGTTDLFDILREGELFDVQHIIWHEQYMPKQFWINDIAILRLEKPIKLSRQSAIISMRPYRLYHGSIFTMTNWPDDIYQTNSARNLKSVDARGLSLERCLDLFPGFIITYMIQGCGKTIWDNESFNMGDGGVGIVYRNEIAGISSIYIPEKPNHLIFTKIYNYREFISDTINAY